VTTWDDYLRMLAAFNRNNPERNGTEFPLGAAPSAVLGGAVQVNR